MMYGRKPKKGKKSGSKGKRDRMQHASHAPYNTSHGLPPDVYAHGQAPYGAGNPTGGTAQPMAAAEGPVAQQPMDIGENEAGCD